MEGASGKYGWHRALLCVKTCRQNVESCSFLDGGAGGAWSTRRRSDRLVPFGILFRDHGNINDRVHSVRDCWNSGLEVLIALSSSSQHDCFSGRQPTAVLAGQRGAELDPLISGILLLPHRDLYNKRAGGRPFPRTMRTNLRCGCPILARTYRARVGTTTLRPSGSRLCSRSHAV